MKRYSVILFFFSSAILLYSHSGYGQGKALDTLYKRFDQYRSQTLVEKLFVHTDQSVYITGQTIWFTIYYVDGSFHLPLNESKVAYVELLDDEGTPVIQTKISLDKGSGNGFINLSNSVNSGNYQFRAYTQWMRNFSPDFYFRKFITVINTSEKLGLKSINKALDYDVQFFPEGGNLILGVKSKVAFRAIDKTGKGIDFSGAILNQSNDTIARFKPFKFGIGNFFLKPLPGNEYRAIIKDRNGHVEVCKLPAILDKGFSLQVRDTSSNYISVRVQCSEKMIENDSPYVYLVVHTGNIITAKKFKTLQNNNALFLLEKDRLANGISHLTVFRGDGFPVCERLYFKRPTNQIHLTANVDNGTYGYRDKVTVDLSLKNISNDQEEANLSVSVSRIDSFLTDDQSTINSYLLLTSELSGTIESVNYYFNSNDQQTNAALDNVMLTHGWSRFQWVDIMNGKKRTYDFFPEYKGHFIRGRVLDSRTNLPASGINTYLSFPGNYAQVHVSRSDQKGEIIFDAKTYGRRSIVFLNDYSIDSTYYTQLINPFCEKRIFYPLPEFNISEKFAKQISERSLYAQIQSPIAETSSVTSEVGHQDNHSFYGRPDGTYLLDDYTRFSSMEDLTREYVKDVALRKQDGKLQFKIIDIYSTVVNAYYKDDPLLLLDGTPVFDTDELLSMNLNTIEKLDVINRKYVLNAQSFDGILSFTTRDKDADNALRSTHYVKLNYDGLQLKKEFYSPSYDDPSLRNNHVPDVRNTLCWIPVIKTVQGKHQFHFYTPDVPGDYRILIQGISSYGNPLYEIVKFSVSAAQK